MGAFSACENARDRTFQASKEPFSPVGVVKASLILTHTVLEFDMLFLLFLYQTRGGTNDTK